jgi:hypothetical protein
MNPESRTYHNPPAHSPITTRNLWLNGKRNTESKCWGGELVVKISDDLFLYELYNNSLVAVVLLIHISKWEKDV